jgi:hypothetical protein
MRRFVTTSVAAVIMVFLAACGGDGGGLKVQATANFVASAAQRTTDKQTGHVELKMSTKVAGQDVSFVADGAYDTVSQRISMNLDLSALLGQVAGGSGAGQLRSLLGDSVEMRFVDNVMYMKMPLLSRLSGGKGTDWVSFAAPTGDAGRNPFGAVGGADPAAFLDYLRGAGADVNEVGHEDVRGVGTTHLSATLTLRKAVESAPDAERARIVTALSQLGASSEQLLDTPISVDVFIDGDGLVRRLHLVLSTPVEGQVLNADVQMDFFDLGTDVSVDPPPADEVTDLTSKLSELGGAFAN